MSYLGEETIIALDSSDISKEFGGNGMEGMEMGRDASRDTKAMEHNMLCASLPYSPRWAKGPGARISGGNPVKTATICLLPFLGVLGLCGCISRRSGYAASNTEVHLGMTYHEVIAQLGNPSYLRPLPEGHEAL